MPVAAILAKPVIGKVIGAVAGSLLSRRAARGSNDRADGLSDDAIAAGKSLQKNAEAVDSRATDRWNFYKDHGENVDIMLIDDAVQMFNETFSGGSEKAAARAAEDVASAFDRSAEVRRRAALRFGGVDPSSGKFQGLERKTETERASAEASARFGARRSEEDRARGVLRSASDLANQKVGQSAGFSGLANQAGVSAARIFSGQQADARADASGSAALIGDIAGKIPFENLFAPKPSSEPAVSSSSLPPKPTDSDGLNFRDGGAIPGDGRRGGMIRGQGTGRSDSVRAIVDGTNQKVRLSAGEFIIPAHVVQKKGERFFQKMIRR
jgi:hypothetical protein